MCVHVNCMLANEQVQQNSLLECFVSKNEMSREDRHDFNVCEGNSLQECRNDGDSFRRSNKDDGWHAHLQAKI